MPRAAVLLSGGIDSTTCLLIAIQDFGLENVVGVSIDYDQRHSKEVEHARNYCHTVGVYHYVLDLSGIIPKTLLTDESRDVPNVAYSEIEGISPAYVPFRNGLMLSALASWLHGHLLDHEGDADWEESAIYFGAHREDAHNWAYPDCTPEFIGAFANALFVGTGHRIRLHTPLQWLMKKDVIALGDKLGVYWLQTWSCYKGGFTHCGICPTCRSRRDGFVQAGVADPTTYEFTRV